MNSDILKWIKDNDLFFCVGYMKTKIEFSAEIWTYFYKLKKMKVIGWYGNGETMEAALQMAYERALIGLQNMPKTEAELNRIIYYGQG